MVDQQTRPVAGLRSLEDVKTSAIGAMVNRAVDGVARNPAELEAVIEHVLAVALDWHENKLPLSEAAKLTTERTRFLAVGLTSQTHPAWPSLMALLDALNAQAGGASTTRHGDFTAAELREAEVKFEYETEHHRELIVFPIRYPWSVKPDPDRAESGVRAPAAYRPAEQRFRPVLKGPAYGRDYRGDRATTTTPGVPWWDQDGEDA